MSGRVSIAQVMMFVALAAVNLAVARACPVGIVEHPPLWVVMGSLDLVIIRKLIQRRSFGAFHYTFLIVMIVSFFVMATLVARESFHPLALPVRWYQRVSGEQTDRLWWAGYVWLAEFWATAVLSFALASAAGLFAVWLDRRAGWDIAAFWRGALLGLFVAGLLATIDDASCGWVPLKTFSVRWMARIALLLSCVILGGLMALRKLRSSKRG